MLRRERGQTLLLMVLAMIGLLGFAGLAIDGGNLFVEQRRAQAAADNASLAAAYQYMNGVTDNAALRSYALSLASSNGFNNDGTSNVVYFYHPPVDGPYTGKDNYFQVVVTETVRTVLIHLVFRGPAQVSVAAVSYGNHGGPPLDGNAVVSLDKTGCGTVQVNGGGNQDVGLTVDGGGVFANSNGSECTGGNNVLDTNGNNASMTAQSPYAISTVATSNAYGNNVSPTPITGVGQQSDPLANLSAPSCGSTPGTAPTDGTINPGTYTELNAHGDLFLNPGIYCVVGTGNNVVNIVGNGSISGSGVLLYVPYGEVNLQGGVISLSAPSLTRNPQCASPGSANQVCSYLGMVLFLGSTNSLGVTLSGNSTWSLEGTIYSPSATVTLGGNSDWGLTGQILSNAVVVSGNGVISVYFDPGSSYSIVPSISLQQKRRK